MVKATSIGAAALVSPSRRRATRDDTQLSCIHATAGLVHPVIQRGAIATHLPPILDRLNIDIDAWLLQAQYLSASIRRAYAPCVCDISEPLHVSLIS